MATSRAVRRFVLVSALLGAPALAEMAAPSAVDAGFVFDRGRFVAGPYAIAQRDVAGAVEVLVAGRVLDRFAVADEASAARSARRAVEPPEYVVPAGVDTLGDSGYPLWLNDFVRYHATRVGIEQALALAAAHASRSPLVARVERLEDGLAIVDRTGDPYFVGAETPLARAPRSLAEARRLADRTLGVYRDLLARGGAILRFDGADVFLPPERVADLLLPSLAVLDAPGLEAAAKRRGLTERWRDERVAAQWMSGHVPSAELDAALARKVWTEPR